MKYVNLIKLLSVLLCIVMLFAACETAETEETTTAVTTETETETQTETETETETDEPYGDVDAKLENFFGFEYEEDWTWLENVERLDDVIIHDDDIAIIRDATVNEKNVVKEEFKVFSKSRGEVILTVENEYYNISGARKFEYDFLDQLYSRDEIFFESNVSVDVVYLYDSYCIEVVTIKLTPVSEEILEENDNACAYKAEMLFEYYDLAGEKLGETRGLERNLTVDYNLSGHSSTCVKIGDKRVMIDNATGERIDEATDITAELKTAFDYENEKYGYYLYGENDGIIYDCIRYVEVYNKKTGELERYSIRETDFTSCIAVLKNGDVLVQTVNYLSDDARIYDGLCYDTKVIVDTYIVDVSAKKIETVELDYIVEYMYERDVAAEMYGLEGTGVSVKDKAWNVAIAMPLTDGVYQSERIVVFNNELESVFELEPIIPAHKISIDGYDTIADLGIKVLVTGDMLVSVELDTVDANGHVVTKAIVTPEGEVRCYLTDESDVIGNFIVNENGIYNFDFKELYSFENNEVSLVGSIGNEIIVYKSEFEWIWDSLNDEYYQTSTYKYFTVKASGDEFILTEVFEGEDIATENGELRMYDDYIVTVSRDYYDSFHKYTMYNAKLEKIVVTQGFMDISEYNGGYFVYSHAGTHVVCYVVTGGDN